MMRLFREIAAAYIAAGMIHQIDYFSTKYGCRHSQLMWLLATMAQLAAQPHDPV